MIFDFDGVIVDSEPIHCLGFQQVLGTVGITLTREQYYSRYLGYDDHDCFQHVALDMGIELTEQQIADLTASKTVLVQRMLSESITAMPGAVALIQAAETAGLPLAICSGALRQEIRLAAATVGVLEHFMAIVSAEDVEHGKPDPEGYKKALKHLASLSGLILQPQKSLVIEDSPAGIESAKAAGMKVLAVATSYPADELRLADRVVHSLEQVTVKSLEDLVAKS